MAKTLTTRIVSWTSRFTLDAVDRSALWVDRLNRKFVDAVSKLARR